MNKVFLPDTMDKVMRFPINKVLRPDLNKVMDIHDVMYTSNPIHDYNFSWTIENLSLLPEMLRGPPVFPIPGSPVQVCLELYIKQFFNKASSKIFYNLVIHLVPLHVKESNLVLSSYTTIRNTNDEIINEAKSPAAKIGKRIQLMHYTGGTDTSKSESRLDFCQKMNLVEDKLIVKGKLSFSGHSIASSVTSLKDGSKVCGNLMEDLKNVYQSGSSSDVTLYIGDETLQAHKFILHCRSPVFAKMFDTDMVESNSNEIFIEDADFYVFNCFLLFLYTDIVEDQSVNTVLSLYSLAHKYQVISLHEICSGLLGNSLMIESVCSTLVLADLHGDKELKDVSKLFIRRYFFQVVGTTEWTDIIIPKTELFREVMASLAS